MAGQSLFQKKPPAGPKHGAGTTANMDAVTHEVRDLGRRLRTLEERYSNLQTKTQITEQNILSRHKRVTVELKTMNMDINELKKEMMAQQP